MSKDLISSMFSSASPITKYVLGVVIIIFAIIALKYIARTLQWATEKF